MNFANKISSAKVFLLFVIFFIGAGNSFAQSNLSNQFEKGVNLFNKENYFDAITEFKRVIFFDTANAFSYRANKMIGDCYKYGGKFSDAIIYYTYSEIAAKSNEEIFAARINAVRANILRGTTARALAMLDSLSNDKRFFNKSGEINYWKGWAYIFSDDWEKAANEFKESNSDTSLINLCEKVESEKYSVPLASALSHIIPGAGQFYTGHIWSGLLSLGWNALWGYVSINAFVENRIFDGFVVSNLLWFRFYRGNFENAEKFAEEKNQIISNDALNFLQYKYSGLKP